MIKINYNRGCLSISYKKYIDKYKILNRCLLRINTSMSFHDKQLKSNVNFYNNN